MTVLKRDLVLKPNLVPNLAAFLIRFRRWRSPATADITKAFLQIAVTESDQDVHRLLWDDKGTIRDENHEVS